MVLKESKTHVSLAFAKHKPSTNQPAVYCHAPLCSAPTAVQARSLHHPYLRRTVNMQHGNTKLDGGSRSHLYQGSLLQQPNLLIVAPVFTSGSLDMLKRSPSPSRHVKRRAHRPQEKKPSTLTYSWLEDKPGKTTAKKAASSLQPQPDHLRPRPTQWAPCRQLEPFVCVLCPGAIP